MKKFNFFLFAALAAAISMILPACSDSDDGPGGDKLVGTWQSCKATGYESYEGRVSKELDGEYLGDAIVLYSNGVYDVVNSRLT